MKKAYTFNTASRTSGVLTSIKIIRLGIVWQGYVLAATLASCSVIVLALGVRERLLFGALACPEKSKTEGTSGFTKNGDLSPQKCFFLKLLH